MHSDVNQRRPEEGPKPDAEARLRVMRDGLLNYLGFLASGVIGLLLVPILLLGMGAEPYGLWIAALSVTRLVASLNFGLYWTVAQEVAAAQGDRDQAARFVSAAGNAYLVLGIVGALLIGILGIPFSSGLRLSPETSKSAAAVFGLVGLSFLPGQLSAFTVAVLHGLRRFDAASLVSVATVFFRAAGIVALLTAGAGLLAVAAWHAAASMVAAVAALVVVARLEPRFRLRMGRLDWGLLRARLPFGFASQLTSAAIDILWDGVPVVIGLMRGSAAIVPYHVGQRFPIGVSTINWRSSEVLFPAASGQRRVENAAGARELLQTGTRLNIVVALPFCLVLWIVAPQLLQAWVGQVPPETLVVLHLTTAAVFADAFGVSGVQVLWGLGRVRAVLALLGGSTLACLGLSVWLLAWMGVAGAAWALFLTMTLRSLFLLQAASRMCEVQVSRLVFTGAVGWLLPGIACGALASGVTYLARPGGWEGVIGTGLAGLGAYALIFYFWGAREEERMFVREVFRMPAILARLAYARLRRAP